MKPAEKPGALEHPVRSGRGVKRENGAALALLAAAVLFLFYPTLLWMNARFFEENSYYGHGWLIPAGIAFLIYQRRGAILASPARPSRAGLLLLTAALSLHLLARVFEINFLSAAALPVVVYSLVLAQFGFGRAKRLIGPLLLSVFMIPLPGIWIIALTFWLKNAAIDAGVALAGWFGFPIVQSGIEVILPAGPPGETLKIGDPCSGLRSLLSFGALGGFFALFLPLSRPRRAAVFLTALLLAPVSNLLRVVSLIVLRQTVGPGILSGPGHIALGVGIFLFCFLIFLQVTRWLLR
jgi:exosortase